MLTRSRFSVLKTSPLDNEINLSGWWTFDGGSTFDRTGNQNNGTLTASPTFTDTPFGGALRLNGSSQYIDVGTVQTVVAPVTFAAWINSAGAGGASGQAIFGGSNSSLTFRINQADSKLHLIKTNLLDMAGSTGTITTGRDTHVAVSYDGSAIAFYINGAASGTAVSAPGGFISNPIKIGASLPGGSAADFFNGTLADVRMYRRVLSEAEINAIYNQGIARLSLSPDEWEMPALRASAASTTSRQYIASPGVYVSETGTRSYMLAPGVYVTETVSAVTASATQYAAFSLPQHSLSQVIQKMVGY